MLKKVNRFALPAVLLAFSFFVFNDLFAQKSGYDFIENKGQWGHGIRYQTEIPNGTLFLTHEGFVYNFANPADIQAYSDALEAQQEPVANGINFHAYKINFLGGNSSTSVTNQGFEKRVHYHNYFLGNDSGKWKGGVGLYGKIKLGNIYNGIDLYVFNKEDDDNYTLEYDFVVGAGVNPDLIQLSFDGVTPRIGNDGSLIIETSVNTVVERAPYCYQEIGGQKMEVASDFVLKDNVLSFDFPNGYNANYPLVIDPNLVFATFSTATGSSPYYAHSTTYDFNGDTYASGFTTGTDWPTTTGAYQRNKPGAGQIACINKYSSDGLQLLFSTYFGGTDGGAVQPSTMRVDTASNFYIAGSTSSNNLPMVSGCYQTTKRGGNDIYIAKLSKDGTTLLAATYIGGNGDEASQMGSTSAYTSLGYGPNPVEIAFDSNNDLWMTGNSASNDYPVTSNAHQSQHGGSMDAVLSKFDEDLKTLKYSTYYGGQGWDGGLALEIDPDDNPVMVGMSASQNLATTSGAYHTANQGGQDGFVARFNNNSGALMHATYVGTSSNDDVHRLDFDCAGNVYIAGLSAGGGYPVSRGAWSSPGANVFVQKLTPDLSTSLKSTIVGSSNSTLCQGFMIDQCGQVVLGIMGGSSRDLELTPDAVQTEPASFYLAVLTSQFDELDFGSYYGTSEHNHAAMSRLDKEGFFYQSVCCTNPDFPIYPPNVFGNVKGNQRTNDVATFKFNFDVSILDMGYQTGGGGNDGNPHCVRGCKSAFFYVSRRSADTIPLELNFELRGDAVNGVDYENIPYTTITIPANQTTATIEIKPLLVPNMPTGDKEVELVVFSPCGCDGGDNTVVGQAIITIHDSLYVKIKTPSPVICANSETEIIAEIDDELYFSWEPQALIPDPRPLGLAIHPKPSATSFYTITVQQPGAPTTCPPHSVTTKVEVEQYPQVRMPARDTVVCINPGDSITLTTYANPERDDYIYKWTPADYLRSDAIRINKFTAPIGTYHYNLKVTSPKAKCEGENEMTIHVVPPFKFDRVTPRDTIVNYGDAIKLRAEGEKAVNWLWLPVDYLNDPNIQFPTSQPLNDIRYQVVGMDEYGCRDTGIVNILVKYVPEYFVPTAFSPNGDGINDIFRIENLRFEKLLAFNIYNREGQQVFSTTNKLNGWDGRIDGRPAPADTYFYLIEIVLPNGERQTTRGDVTLLR